MKATARQGLKRFLKRTGALRLASPLVAKQVAILRYHAIEERPQEHEHSIGTAIIHTPECFFRQMELITRRYHPVTLDDIVLFVRGEQDIPRGAAAVTFDDGYLDNYLIAAPILEHFGIKAAFYITVDALIGKRAPWFCRLRHAFGATRKSDLQIPSQSRSYKLDGPTQREDAFIASCKACACSTGDAQETILQAIESALEVDPLESAGLMMNRDHLRALRDGGHIIGSHTMCHPNLAQIGQEEVESELHNSKTFLEAVLKQPAVHFSYPNPILQPHWTHQTSAVAERIGYQTAVTSESGPVRSGDNPLALHRISVPQDPQELAWSLDCTLLGMAV
jgi:peptidoglycan/xylan/chitin deacetylase (PgdA/CDA1 family)